MPALTVLGVTEPGERRELREEEARAWATVVANDDDDSDGGRTVAVMATNVEISRWRFRCARANAAGDRAAAAAAAWWWVVAEVVLLVQPEVLPVPLLTLRLPLRVRCRRTYSGTVRCSDGAEYCDVVVVEKTEGSTEERRRPLRWKSGISVRRGFTASDAEAAAAATAAGAKVVVDHADVLVLRTVASLLVSLRRVLAAGAADGAVDTEVAAAAAEGVGQGKATVVLKLRVSRSIDGYSLAVTRDPS